MKAIFVLIFATMLSFLPYTFLNFFLVLLLLLIISLMEAQDHKITAPSSGHENHGPRLCHKCGWPFRNPHPSARHRRAHKKVCGKIEGYKRSDAVEASVDTDENTSNNESYESKPLEAEGKSSDPLSLSSDLLGAKPKLLEAEEKASDSVPNEAELQHNKRENPNSADLKLSLSEAEVSHEQLNEAEQDKQRISTELSPYAPILESKAISSASQNEGDDKLIKQNDTVSAVDTPISSSSRADSLDANWGSISVLSTQSESTAVPDAETTDTRRLDKSEHDFRKPTSGAEEYHPDKSDVYEPSSFMTLVESGESSAYKKATASEIKTQLNAQQPKTEALKAGWFPSITNVVNESQGRKKNEEIIAKVTNWSTGMQQHTPLKSLLGEARSPNVKQVPPSVNKKDEAASTKTTTVNSILSSEAPTAVSKEAEKKWNSRARYPVDIKKEKRKTKRYWVPSVCCPSVHQEA